MIRIWAVMHRDLLRTLRNPFSIFSAILLPLLYLLILGNSLQGPLTGLKLGMVTLDDGREARDLLGALQAVEEGPGTVVLVAQADPQAGIRSLRRGAISGLLVIPPDFSRDIEHGRAASAGLYLDNVDAIASGAIEAAVQGALPSLHAPLARFETHLGPAEIRAQELYPRVDYDTSLVPAVIVMSIFSASMLAGAFNLIFDRFLGVHESYLSTPLTRTDINLGVLASGTVVIFCASTIVLVVGLLATGARVHGGAGGYLALVGTILLTALGMLAMMMILLGRADHPRIAGVVSGFLNVILFFPSGALYPLASFPPWLRAFAQADPETHAIAAIKAILFRGGDLAAAGHHILFLAVFTALMLAISTMTLKRTL